MKPAASHHDLAATLQAGVQALGLDLSSAQQQSLLDFLDLLQKWNKVYNLTAVRNPQEMLTHHLLDSLAAVPALQRHLATQPEAARLLDVGCGGGILTEALTKTGATTLGVDLAEKSLKIAQLHALETELQNVSYRCVSVEDLATEQAGQYDVVTCMEMMEHVPDPASVIRSCAELAKDDGWVFFSTINRNPKAYAQTIVAAEYIMGLLPRGTHDYKKFVTPAEMARMCRQAGLEIVNFTGFTFNPLTNVYSLCDSIDVNYMAACRKTSLVL